MRDWAFNATAAVSLLCAFPAVYLLARVYLSKPVTVTIIERKLDVQFMGVSRGSYPFSHTMSMRFRDAAGNEYGWSQQLPVDHLEGVWMLFDKYPPGTQTTIFADGANALLRRGLPDWRFGLGWGLTAFALVFGFFAYMRLNFSMEMPFIILGTPAFLFGAYFYQQLEAKRTAWPRVRGTIVETFPANEYARRAPDLSLDQKSAHYLKDRKMESIQYAFGGKFYLYPASRDVSVDPGPEGSEILIDPAQPESASRFPSEDDYTGAKVALGLGGLMMALGLIPLLFFR